jgi:hypothetical protein
MEIYVFVQMGGEREAMVVKPLDADAGLSLAQFDAAKAQCFLPRDRDKLLAVIEASFGTFAPFNKKVRGYFAEKLARDSVSSTCFSSLASSTTGATAVVAVEIT